MTKRRLIATELINLKCVYGPACDCPLFPPPFCPLLNPLLLLANDSRAGLYKLSSLWTNYLLCIYVANEFIMSHAPKYVQAKRITHMHLK